ncbi:DNA-directed RNA polymerase III subunit RPC4 [Coemansia guatemalensis]|uniref:DNA-directed RNA polymerase III subunit RPC4 n=1 Tax=Coemansia guatemalensis TaxID=2761395 RepID=A0A9W8I2U1_9FUNG|nr:DNA-directed RNA polymerase III subunit RPC4 [Coemansia guatemalensis]
MSDTPDKKPQSGRRTLRGRGRGGSTTPGSSTGALPNQRLSSLRDNPQASTSGTAKPAGKMKFTPKIPVRRNKREPAAPSSIKPETETQETKPAEQRLSDSKGVRGGGPQNGRGGRGNGRKRVELTQRITGPFAQGPASLGSHARRGPATASGIAYGGAAAKTEADDGGGGVGGQESPAVVRVTDYNERDGQDEFDVQTEEMALAAFEEMSRLQLDYDTADALGLGKSEGPAEEKLVVLQIPRIPEFELSKPVLQRRRVARQQQRIAQRQKAAAAAMDVDAAAVDVKPDIAALEKAAGADGDVTEVDIKPDVSAADAKHAETADSAAEEKAGDSDLAASVDGRAGTLVVLRSGAVKLKIGDVLFDVSRGADCQFLRGLLAVDVRSGSSSAYMLGNVDAQLLCTPDLDSIL